MFCTVNCCAKCSTDDNNIEEMHLSFNSENPKSGGKINLLKIF